MNDESTQRISQTTAAFMIVVATIFDLAQIASKLLALMGTPEAGGILGQIACHYANINAPDTCKVVGATAGAIASFVPGVGPAFATAVRMVGMAMSELASGVFMLAGYATMYFWFLQRGAPILSGKNMQKRATIAFVSMVVDITPLLNVMPGITLWTIQMVMLTRAEDKEKEKGRKTGYNDGAKNYSRMRKPIRQHV